ncbi:hypothetical protein [Vibrio parahaemolyticus]|uniref:hypothetical protein n=1 Tax=Vibrio parahaemolyticus TaxID=670 RepID=UPI0005F12834|nr:hypothetical protein [Vibrio parahaemolyticus]TOH77744.1 hypothetical protein CGI73_23455 [Vibrio parahaemolyticus]TOH87449.1 hypothetical protein CGI72_22240 [Vibrio parahaemolyticus]HCH4213835.1 hypothetical protein [Vibrio parahaemolyticus]
MKFSHLHSDDLPNIDMSIKRCINSGQWFLFKAPTDESEAFYMLKVNNTLYSLDRSGSPLNEMRLDSELVMDEIFYFDDIDSPTSLSNQLTA